jgi:hypothetical protein
MKAKKLNIIKPKAEEKQAESSTTDESASFPSFPTLPGICQPIVQTNFEGNPLPPFTSHQWDIMPQKLILPYPTRKDGQHFKTAGSVTMIKPGPDFF